MTQILIIEDEEPIRRVMVRILSEESASYEITEAEDGKKGLSKLEKNSFDLVLCDIKMPKMDGIEVLQAAKAKGIYVPFIMLTGHGNVETAVEAMKLGAYDFIAKPPDLNRLLTAVRHAIENKTLRKENLKLKRKVAQKYTIVGESEPVIKMKEMISKVAPTDARVLITGENGTGKELVAHQLHQQSDRSKENFIEVNCAAIPSELIESELFGHVKGAFTSAVKDRSGKFEAANKGTLFLDEIADMSLAAQAKVLRALQEKKIQRVGNEKDISVDVRVIAATNKDLLNEIKEGRFREDLYHRLAVIMIHVPSLDDRKEDIPLLVSHFVDLLSKEQGLEKKSFSDGAYFKLNAYPWTGNVRELRNVVERLLILGENPISSENIVQFAPK
ncbi:MAG: Transcriptional regulatory protein ZraR [uncultured Bacteroidota bacterium]|jgi:two-component system nitrogen regulation response regulator NtrX|nr:MAG: Transcriptional regulatory protein ZraR [uncultured Bacteroidetes bacterium]|tara:strand:+ start:54 stop:1217 length:1164 start_codon:yes stop_codon:yes gene_type:complete